MTDFVKTLTRKNSLRKQCQALDVAEIEKVISDLNEILAEHQAKAEEERAEREAKQRAIDEVQRAMEQAGLSLDDLQETVVAKPAKRKVEAKYRVTDEEGEEHLWSGRGRTPVVFKEYFERTGKSKEDTRIK